MNLLLCSDLHASAGAAERLAAMAASVDLIVGAGDFGNARRDVGVCIDILRRARKPAVLVPGNNESLDELRSACQGWHDAAVLHGTGTELLGVQFFGLGGGVPVTPFGPWSWDLPEAEAMKLLERCPAAAVLVSHSPPQGVVDRSSSGKNLGSTSVRDAVMRSRPRLVVCGHIHASGGQTGMLGTSPVVNAGPAGMIWTL